MSMRTLIGIAFVFGICASPATARDEAKPGESDAVRPAADGDGEKDSPRKLSRLFAVDSPRLTGDWGGLRSSLEDHGVKFSIFLNRQYGSVLKGGADTNGSGRRSASMDALITFDLEQLEVIPQAEVLLHLQANWGSGINLRTGALNQVNDDADGSIGGHVAQLWYRHHFFDRRVSFTLGYLDYQTIIDRNAYANSEDKQFMHQTLDNNPLVPLTIGMGATLTLKPVDWYTLILGVADAQAQPYKGGISKAFHEEDWFRAYVENDLHVKIPTQRGSLPGDYRVGVFYDPGTKNTFLRSQLSRRTRSGDYGLYVSLDQMIFRETDADMQGLGLFARFAYRSPENNRMSRFWSGGLSYTGLFPGRDDDVAGLAFSLLRSSHLYRNRVNDLFTNETVYELYYAIQVTKWLVVTPDIQYVDNPGASGDFGQTVVAGLRARVSF